MHTSDVKCSCELKFTHWNKANVHQQPGKPNPKPLKNWQERNV